MKAYFYLAALLATASLANPVEAQFDDRPDMIELLADGKVRTRPTDTSLLMNIGAVYTGLATIAGCEIERIPEGVDGNKLRSRFRDALAGRLDLAVVMSPGSPLLAAHPNALRAAALAASRGCADPGVQRLLVETVMALSDYRNQDIAERQEATGVPLSREKSLPLNPRFIGGLRSQRNVDSDAELQAIQDARVATARSGQYVLSCTYGPKNADGTGFSQIDFWHESLPPFSWDEMLRLGPNNELANIPYVALDACPETEEKALAQRREYGFPHPGSVAFDPTLGNSGVMAEAPQPDPTRSLGTSETDDKGRAEPEEASRDVAREQRAAPTKPKRPAAVDGPPTSIAGTYSVQGRNPNGATYSGTLRVSRIDGDIYGFRWAIAGQTYRGKGAWKDGRISVDYGDQYPAIYSWNEDGYLDGTWAGGSGAERLIPNGS